MLDLLGQLGRTWNYLLQIQEDTKAGRRLVKDIGNPSHSLLGPCLGLEGDAKENSFWGKRCGYSQQLHSSIFFSLVTRSSQERCLLKTWSCAPLLSLFLWPSHLGRWAEAFSWAPALGRKGTRSTSAFGGKLWLSRSVRARGVALADPHSHGLTHGGWRGAPR